MALQNYGSAKFNALVPIQRWLGLRDEISDAIWLLLLLSDEVTLDVIADDGSRWGLVLGNRFGNCAPVTFKRLAQELGVCVKTIQIWHQKLERLGLICSKRTPHGYSIVMSDSIKWMFSAGRTVQLRGWTVESWSKGKLDVGNQLPAPSGEEGEDVNGTGVVTTTEDDCIPF